MSRKLLFSAFALVKNNKERREVLGSYCSDSFAALSRTGIWSVFQDRNGTGVSDRLTWVAHATFQGPCATPRRSPVPGVAQKS